MGLITGRVKTAGRDAASRPGSRAGSGRSTRTASPTWSTGPGSATTCVSGRRCWWRPSDWSGSASGWTGTAPCTARGSCCARTSCGRRCRTTTRTGARACMRRFYALVRLSYGEPASPAEAARLEVDWWRVHRERQYSTQARGAGDELVESVTRLYSYLYREPGGRGPAGGCRTGPGRWTCPTSGSPKAASRTARCYRSSMRHWSAATPRCSLPSITEPSSRRRRAARARTSPGLPVVDRHRMGPEWQPWSGSRTSMWSQPSWSCMSW